MYVYLLRNMFKNNGIFLSRPENIASQNVRDLATMSHVKRVKKSKELRALWEAMP